MQAEVMESLAGPEQSTMPEEEDASSTFLTFDLNEQSFAVQVEYVREILDAEPITKLPNAPHDVMGVIDVRGASVPVYDLYGQLGTSATQDQEDTRLVVFEIKNSSGSIRPVGILSDRVRDVCRIRAQEIEQKPDLGGYSIDPDLVIGLTRLNGKLVILLNLAAMFGNQGNMI